MNILVLCTGNSARSILLEAILTQHSNAKITAFSAGSKPAGQVHPESLALLQSRGFDTTSFRSKSWDEFGAPDAPQMDAVITVCGSAAAEECPYWPGAPVRVHWGVDDPAAAPPEEQPLSFQIAYDLLNAKAQQFLAIDATDLRGPALQAALTKAGEI